jgi:hypothetical protein
MTINTNDLISKFQSMTISETSQNDSDLFYVTMIKTLGDKTATFHDSLRKLNLGLRKFKECTIKPNIVSKILKSVYKRAKEEKRISKKSIIKFLNRIGQRKWEMVAYLKKTGKHLQKITKNFSKLATFVNYRYAKYCPALIQYKIIKACYNSIEAIREKRLSWQLNPASAISQKNLLLKEIKTQYKKLQENKLDKVIQNFIEKANRKVIEDLEGDTLTRLPSEHMLICKGDKIKISPRAK